MAPMLGPFAALDEICRRPVEPKPQYSRCGADVPASTRFFEGKTVLDTPAEPFLEARLVGRNDWDDTTALGDGNTVYHLGIRTREGWFFLEELERTNEPAMGSHHEWLVVESMRVVEWVGEGALLELRYAWNMSDDDQGADETTSGVSSAVVVCGVSSGGRPRCTLPTPVAERGSVRRISNDAVLSGSAWQLEVRYAAGSVELTLPAGASGAGVPAPLVGAHPLDFDAGASP